MNESGLLTIKYAHVTITEKFAALKDLRKLMYKLKGFGCEITVSFNE